MRDRFWPPACRPRNRVLAVTGLLAAAAILAVMALSSGSSSPARARADVVSAGARSPHVKVDYALTVGGPSRSPAVPSGFVGLALEQPSLFKYAGTDPSAIDPVFEQLTRSLDPGQPLVLRLAGDSTDWDWYPVQGMTQPAGIRYTLTPDWLAVSKAVASGIDARLILGVNMEAGSATIAAAEANAMVKMIGRSSIDALELGNEPEFYASFAWYKTQAGVGVPGRPAGWDFTSYSQQYGAFVSELPSVPLIGPAVGTAKWLPASLLGTFLSDHPQVKVASVHRYPLVNCSGKPTLTAAQLLATSSTVGLAGIAAPYVPVARSQGVPLRVDEMNTISCGGQKGLGNGFASALWSIDALFAMAKVGVDGVNIQTTANAADTPFTTTQSAGKWTATVNPLYYGLIMFAQAAPAGSRLLQITGALDPSVRAWATRATDGTERVLLINTASARSETIALTVSGESGNGSLERLRASGLGAEEGVTLAGQSFGAATATGRLAGKRVTSAVTQTQGRYVVSLPAASAALLIFSKQPAS